MKLAIAMLLFAGCWDSSFEDYPLGPPQLARTASTGGGEQVKFISGRVCALVDARFPTDCDATAGGGLTISLGTSTTRTAPDGSFHVVAPTGTNLAFVITGSGIVQTQVGFSTNTTLPALTLSLYAQMLASVAFSPGPENGAVIVYVSRAGTPLANVGVVATPGGIVGPFFDGSSALAWTTVSTGAAGVIWLPAEAAGSTSLGLTDLGDNTAQTVEGVPVIAGGITMVDAVFP